ncbi:hypothetical protein HY379_00655 [Candidatus Saccharibacteria bacterium]|nr:hypothetical protein [Candidatus Saccharibacteria bacterium]
MSDRQTGDTIIEVMLAVTVMGVALAASYSLSNRSFHTAQNTQERTAALSLAQGQIEFLRDSYLSGTSGGLVTKYNEGQPFCFNDSNGTDVSADGSPYCNNYGPSDNKGLYAVAITYCGGSGCSPAGVFTVKTLWTGAGTASQNNVTLHYKLPGVISSASQLNCPAQSVSVPPASELYYRGPTSYRRDLAAPLKPPCVIDLEVTTIDESHPDNPQLHEQVFIELYNSGNPAPLFTTGLTPDIPDADTQISYTFSNILIGQQVDYMLIKHSSIYPGCSCTESSNSVHGVNVSITAR